MAAPSGSATFIYSENMYSHYNYKFKRDVVILHPGEYYATRDNCLVSTVLGSCVAVVLYDEAMHVGGMNHFMLPGISRERKNGHSRYSEDLSGKLGVNAMELLINSLMKEGGRRQHFKAKVFGGGNVLDYIDPQGVRSGTDIGGSNVDLAFSFLEREQIPIISSDVRGYTARKLFLEPRNGYVYLKRMERTLLEPIKKIEENYIEELEKKAPSGNFDLFT